MSKTLATPVDLFMGFLESSSTCKNESDAFSEKDQLGLELRKPLKISCFESMDGELKWSEKLQGWIKQQETLQVVEAPEPSSKQFLKYLVDNIKLTDDTTTLKIEELKRLETGIETTYFHTKDSGQFQLVFLVLRLERGELYFCGPKKAYGIKLIDIRECRTGSNSLMQLKVPTIEDKTEFLNMFNTIYFQFANKHLMRKILLMADRNRYAIVVLKNSSEEGLLTSNIDMLTKKSNYLALRKKYAAKYRKKQKEAEESEDEEIV